MFDDYLSGIGDYSLFDSEPTYVDLGNSDFTTSGGSSSDWSFLDGFEDNGINFNDLLSGIGDYSFTDPIEEFNFNDWLNPGYTVDLSNSDYDTDGNLISSDESSGGIGGLLRTILGLGNSALGSLQEVSNTPMGGVLSALAAALIRRSINGNVSDAENAANAQTQALIESQMSKAPIRTGLPNFNKAQRDPRSYVAPSSYFEGGL